MSFVTLDAAVSLRPQPLPVRGSSDRLASARAVTRDLTYAHAARTVPARGIIRGLEAATGRGALIRRAAGYEAEVAAGADFWRVMMERFGIRLDVVRGSLGAIPDSGPLVVVANHPFGILDGLVMGHILSGVRRGDFRVMAHQVFGHAEDLRRSILPVDFAGTPDARDANLRTRAEAIGYLRAGGAVGIFPGGTVSTARHPMGQPMDPLWRSFTARMIARSGATVVPIWFDGQNSRLFQLASHLSPTLRVALLLREFRVRVDRPVRLAIGAPIPAEVLSRQAGDGKQMMDFLRRATYGLSPKPLDADLLGHEFEEHHKR